MYILKDAFVLTFNSRSEFGIMSLLIDGTEISDTTTPVNDISQSDNSKVQKWIDNYNGDVNIIDCSQKLILPAFYNSCLKSEGSLIKYLMRRRHYESAETDLCTDFIFNYLSHDSISPDFKKDLYDLYLYSLNRQLKSGIGSLNEFSTRKDINHLQPINEIAEQTGQEIICCYPIKQDTEIFNTNQNIGLAYYLTDENQLTIYNIAQLSEIKGKIIHKLFLEVATNKDITDKFRQMFGKPIIKLLDEYHLIDHNTFLINPLYLTYEELKIISDKKVNLIICPSDLAAFTNRYFPFDDFINHNIAFTIGTGWLGEDILREIRILKNKFKELNISATEFLKSVTIKPGALFITDTEHNAEHFSVSPKNKANLIFIDISDIRFLIFPEKFDLENLCSFIIDNLTISNISDVMLKGEFKIRDSELLCYEEKNLINTAKSLREKLYKIGKYQEIIDRIERKKNIDELDLRNRNEDEIKLFSEPSASEQQPEVEEKFKIKAKIPIFSVKPSSSQKNLFEDTEQINLCNLNESTDTPAVNLLYTEIKEEEISENEILQSRITEEQLLKHSFDIKKSEKTKQTTTESKIELPKNVKLKFGDD